MNSRRAPSRPQSRALRSAIAALSGVAICCGASLPVAHAGTAAATAGTPGNVDTGIRRNQCYASGANALASCAAVDLQGQDGQLGRDTYSTTNSPGDGALGLSFTRVCNSGQAAGAVTGTCPAVPVLGTGPDDWGCVTDNVTGIMWEVKTTSGLRARDLTYTNYSPDDDPVGEYGSPTDASGYVDAVNASLLCGHADWGLAHTAKVQTIVDYGISAAGAARVDPAFFPGVAADWYWNASPNLSSTTTAFAVDFADGAVSNAADRSTRRYAQVIRNAKKVVGPNGQYEFSPDGTEVRDTTVTATLTWRRCVEGMRWDGGTCVGVPLTFSHEAALRWAAAQAAATGEAWRVPSVKELDWIVDREIPTPPIKHFAFPATPPAATWTSTPDTRKPKTAWAVDFSVGLVVQHPRTDALVLRLARDTDGQ